MSYHYHRHNLMKDQNIFIAAKCGDVNLLRDLINAGHPVSHKDKYGKTALHHAVEGKKRRMCSKQRVFVARSHFVFFFRQLYWA